MNLRKMFFGGAVAFGLGLLGAATQGMGSSDVPLFESFLLGQTVLCYGAEEAWDMLPVCDEEEYLLLATDNSYANIYDCRGNCVGSCRAYLNDAATVKKDSLLEYTSGETSRVFSMAEMKNILEVSSTTYTLAIQGNVCLVTDRYTGKCSLYNCHGELLYSSGDREWTDARYQGQIVELENGYLVSSKKWEETGLFSDTPPVWVSRDGQQWKEITDQRISEAMASWSLYKFGENILIYDYSKELGAVYDLEGRVLLDQVKAYLSPNTDDHWFYGYSYTMDTAFVLKLTDGMYTVYDTKLQEAARFPAKEGDRQDLGCSGGFFKGSTYQQLEGRECAGFVLYGGEKWCPYAETEEGCLVYADQEALRIPLQPGENLTGFNDGYLMKGYYGDGIYMDRLTDRKTGEKLLESYWDEGGGVSFELGLDYCIITRTVYDQEVYETSFTIWDENKQVCCSSQKGRARAWKNGYIVLQRGIYNGIADRSGNWILRTVYGVEE